MDTIFTVVENAKSKYDVKPTASEIKEDYNVLTEELVGTGQNVTLLDPERSTRIVSLLPQRDIKYLGDLLAILTNVDFSSSTNVDFSSSSTPSGKDSTDLPTALGKLNQFLEETKAFEKNNILKIDPDSFKPRRDRSPLYFTEVRRIVEITRAPALVELMLTSASDNKSQFKTFFRVNRTRAVALNLGIVSNLSDQNIVTKNSEGKFDTTKNRDRGIDPIIGVHAYWRRHDVRHKKFIDYLPSPFVAFNLRGLQDNLYFGFATELKGVTFASGLNRFRTDQADEENARVRKTYKKGYFVSITVDPILFVQLFKPALGLK